MTKPTPSDMRRRAENLGILEPGDAYFSDNELARLGVAQPVTPPAPAVPGTPGPNSVRAREESLGVKPDVLVENLEGLAELQKASEPEPKKRRAARKVVAKKVAPPADEGVGQETPAVRAKREARNKARSEARAAKRAEKEAERQRHVAEQHAIHEAKSAPAAESTPAESEGGAW